MDYINIQGDENSIIQELSKYMNQGGAKLIVQNLSSYIDILDNDEIFDVKEEKREQENGLGFMIPKTNYYLNVRKTTIAFIGLLFDIQFTVRRHIMGGANRTLISALLPPRLRSRVGNRKLSAGQPHAVAALLEKQESCF